MEKIQHLMYFPIWKKADVVKKHIATNRFLPTHGTEVLRQ